MRRLGLSAGRWAAKSRYLRASSGLLLPRCLLVSEAQQHICSLRLGIRQARYATTETSKPESNDVSAENREALDRPLTKHERNQIFRDAFSQTSPEIDDLVESKLGSVFVPPVRAYSSPLAQRTSRLRAKKHARVQVGFDTIWGHFDSLAPEWTDIFSLLKKMTPKSSEKPKMAAMRVVLPASWDMNVANKGVEFIDSTTGLSSRLRLSTDSQFPSAIIMRGSSKILTKAADELVAACQDVQIFKLGDVVSFDYQTTRLWPAIQDSPNQILEDEHTESIWVHKDVDSFWIERPYEKTQRPRYWTKDSFEKYITTLVLGRLKPNLAMSFYQKNVKDGRMIDTDGIRVNLIMQAFQDPEAKGSITPWALKSAISFMALRGGHIASADRLLTLAEDWGIPLDTDTFNSILKGYMVKGDVTYFYKLLNKMHARCFQPNAATWLLFLELVKRDGERRQIIAAMFERGFFAFPATRRGIAVVMAEQDAHNSFRAGLSFAQLMEEQVSRYGQDWYSGDAFTAILAEFLLFHRSKKHYDAFFDFRYVIFRLIDNGHKIPARAFDVITKHCASLDSHDMANALWAIRRLEALGLAPSPNTYQNLLVTSVNTGRLDIFSRVLFHGIFKRKISSQARAYINQVLMGQTKYPVSSKQKSNPLVLSKEMVALLHESPVNGPNMATAGVEWAALSTYPNYVPEKSLFEAIKIAYPESTLKNGKLSQESLESAPTPITIVVTKQEKRKHVRLQEYFDPNTMVKRNRIPKQKPQPSAVDDTFETEIANTEDVDLGHLDSLAASEGKQA